MLRTRVIPCLLLKGNGLVKTIKFKDEKYVGDPINAVRIFNDKEVDELIFLDIDATAEGRGPRMDYIRDIASECFMPLCYGGGISTMKHIEELFQIGVEKVSINTAAAEDPNLISQAAEVFGSQSIVAAVDVRKSLIGGYSVYTHRASRKQPQSLEKYIRYLEGCGAGEIFLHSVDQDGCRLGYDEKLISMVCQEVGVPVIASGGAGSVGDFYKAVRAGASAVSAGSFFVFHGKHRAVLITYPEYQELEEALLKVPEGWSRGVPSSTTRR